MSERSMIEVCADNQSWHGLIAKSASIETITKALLLAFNGIPDDNPDKRKTMRILEKDRKMRRQ